MKVLVLDDDRFRHECFAAQYAPAHVAHAYTYDAFLQLLADGSPWDLIHLDHDLGDMVDGASAYVDGWGKRQDYNGQHAALRVAELPEELRPPKVIIQSVNSVGAQHMLAILQRAGIPTTWEPFGESTLLLKV